MPIFDSGPIDNSQTGKAAFAEVSAVNAGRFPTNVSVQLYELPPLAFGTQTNNPLFTSLFYLYPRGNPNDTLSSGLVALGSAFGVRVISSGIGEDDIAVHVTLYDSDNRIIGTLNIPATAPTPLLVYGVNNGSDNVSVVEAETEQVTTFISTTSTDPTGVASTPDGTKLYVTVQSTNSVDVYETATNTLITTIPVGLGPVGVFVRPDGVHAYVTNIGGDSVSVIDVATDTIIGAPILTGSQPFAVSFVLSLAKAYVTNSNGNSVTIINTNTLAPTGTIPLPANPVGIATTPDDKKAYACVQLNTLAVIDTATDTLLPAIPLPVGSGVSHVAVTPDGSRAYVTASVAGMLFIVDTKADIEVPSQAVVIGMGARGIAITPDGNKAFVTATLENYIAVVDLQTNTRQQLISTGVLPSEIAITPNLLF
ncbi:YncE family protein [Paenibacillus sp. SC116]|uniref:YncE family protein n=1 Tax=Paenibacillus sp. SC116 TaxID=2968986 RepID=UPI00215A3E45|nr:YncE family protein [Paenibacillus sp. SC116]MCR8844221.1 YncE family protein [Paenibacillus sp. SC116]